MLCSVAVTEPVTLLSHCGLQLGQVRTARSWSFGFVTIGAAGTHLVRGGRQRLAHRDEVVGGGDENPACLSKIMISWELFIQKSR